MPRVPNKNNYTISAPPHLEKVTHHATLAKMHNQLAYGGFPKQKKKFKDRIQIFFLQKAKPPFFNGNATQLSWWKSKMYSYIIGIDDEL